MKFNPPEFDIEYGTGEVIGITVNDTLRIGTISVPRQAIGAVLEATNDFIDSSCDGLFVSSSKAPFVLCLRLTESCV